MNRKEEVINKDIIYILLLIVTLMMFFAMGFSVGTQLSTFNGL